MPRQPLVPEALRFAPFRVAEAASHGLTRRQLDGHAWVRVFPGVWRWRELPMCWPSWHLAARACLPDDARPTGCTRLRELGLEIGDPFPLHFVVGRDHHVVPDPRIRLHRTVVTPPTTESGISPSAAFVEFCGEATLEDAVVAGDWLLGRGHMSGGELGELIAEQSWRHGAAQARVVSGWLNGAGAVAAGVATAPADDSRRAPHATGQRRRL